MSERIKIMESMHNIILVLNNEGAYFEWITLVPDGATEEDLYEIATNDELFEEATDLFKYIIKTFINGGLYINHELY